MYKRQPKAAAKILKMAKSRRVDQGLAQMIVNETSAFGAEDETKLPKEQQQRLEEEAAAILDNPPSDLPPPPEPVPLETDRYLHEKLAALIVELKKLVTKSTDRFVGCEIEPHDLENAAAFLQQVATKIVNRRAAEMQTNSGGGDAQLCGDIQVAIKLTAVGTYTNQPKGRCPKKGLPNEDPHDHQTRTEE